MATKSLQRCHFVFIFSMSIIAYLFIFYLFTNLKIYNPQSQVVNLFENYFDIQGSYFGTERLTTKLDHKKERLFKKII
jgi:hypothetical protein